VSFETLGRRLFPEVNPATRARNRSTAWTNFYHRTDYVGQCTFVNTDRAAFDFELPDPAKRPPYRRRSVWTSWAVAADPPLPTFTPTTTTRSSSGPGCASSNGVWDGEGGRMRRPEVERLGFTMSVAGPRRPTVPGVHVGPD